MVKKELLPPLQPAARSLNVRIYAIVLVFSAFLFLVGILVGTQLSSGVSREFLQKADDLQANSRELELTLLLLSSAQGDVAKLCPALLEQASSLDRRTNEFGISLDALEKSRGRFDANVQSLKRQYSIMQVRDYLLYKQIASQCSTPLKQIIFFYTNEGCRDCVEQGQILREFKRGNQEVLVYTLDVDIGTPVVSALISTYNLTHYPALVVNGEVVQGKKTGAELQAMLGINSNSSSSS